MPDPNLAKHPLIGKFVRFDVNGGESYCVSRFEADLGGGLMLARRFSPHTGKALVASHIIVLSIIAQSEMNEIYDSWAALARDMGCSHTAAVVALVPKP